MRAVPVWTTELALTESMASTAVALQDLPATDAKLVRYLLLLVALHFRQNLQLAMYPFKHLKKSVGRCWMLMADKYGSILNPHYIIYIYIWVLHHPTIETMLMMLYQDMFLLGGSRVHWIVLQFYWPRIRLGPWKYRKQRTWQIITHISWPNKFGH